MTQPNTFVVIMAGGIGSRFWPFSRTSNPKQFHDVLGVGESMLQLTANRLHGICPQENIYVVTNKDYRTLVAEQLPFLKEAQILCEPIGRNTAPAIAYACFKIHGINPETKALSGIITDGDLRRMLTKFEADMIGKISAMDIMTANPLTVEPDTYAAEALAIMQQKNITQLIVAKSGKFEGFVHLHDLLKEGLV